MKMEESSNVQDLRAKFSLPPAASSKLTTTKGDLKTVGLGDNFNEITKKLKTGSKGLEIIAIVGMAGIGKSTLAEKVYKQFTEASNYFDICAWVTVSQSYKQRENLIGLLSSIRGSKKHYTKELLSESTQQLAQYFYQSLCGHRYLVVLDDVWDTEFWDDLSKLFPRKQNNVGSWVLLTTRYKGVAEKVSSCISIHEMNFLNEKDSWKLFCDKVFGEGEHLPDDELKEVGKSILKHCGGLPFALVLLGGLLSTEPKTKEYWRLVAGDLNSIMISNDDRWMKAISLSYTHLPNHLKHCFLYISIFPEDFDIPVSKLVKLWVAEGFVKPMGSRSLEDVAYDYLSDFVARSLILPGERGSIGRIRTCKIHDLTREFCTREAKEDMVFDISDKSLSSIKEGGSLNRLSIHANMRGFFSCDEGKLSSLQMSSLFSFDRDFNDSVQRLDPRPLRVLDMVETVTGGIQGKLQEKLFSNLHYLASNYDQRLFSIPSSCVFPNLQTLILRPIVSSFPHSVKVAIWNMPQLRHVQMKTLSLPDPPDSADSPFVILENLQTLSQVQNFKCSSEVLKRIPNLKKLGITCFLDPQNWQYYRLDNLECLHNLEALKCQFFEPTPSFLHSIRFPQALVKLSLEGCGLLWEEMGIVGSLPNLKVLKLKHHAFEGPKWEPKEEQFLELQYLLLEQLNLVDWRATSDHFPKLQHLIIRYCRQLKAIPRDVLEMPTLQLVEVKYSSNDLTASVLKLIKDEEIEGLQFSVQKPDSLWLNNKEMAEDEPETEES